MTDHSTANILLVEPESILADLTAFRLELLGFDMTVVSAGAQARDQLRQKSFDLLVVDTKLPEGDGIEWLTELRLEVKQDEMPVLMLSLDPSLESVRRAYLAGAQDYLITPFDPTVLEEKIQVLLALQTESVG